MTPMNRREALKTTVALGGALALSGGILESCARDQRAPLTGMLIRRHQDLAEDIADTLLPKTASSPGAKEAGAGPAINLLITDCYEPAAQEKLVHGLEEFRWNLESKHHKEFGELPRKDREDALRILGVEARKSPDTHWFPLMRELALRSYFSSQIGMTKALRYMQVPGKWVGCMPYTPGQPSWG
jgi:hypothetical protein